MTTIIGQHFPNPTTFALTGFPQLTMIWLAFQDPARVRLDEITSYQLTERFVMALFYSLTRGTEWLQGIWGVEKDTCNWERLLCNQVGDTLTQMNMCTYHNYFLLLEMDPILFDIFWFETQIIYSLLFPLFSMNQLPAI